MIIRKIHPGEVKRTEELFSIAFDSPYTNDSPAMELYEKYMAYPANREQAYPLERFAAFEDDDATMMSCFVTTPFEINFDGRTQPMYGIGGVSTLPQYRKRGGIRACFEKALPCLYAQGGVFSYLYPFSTAYYRKFGYELCCKKAEYRIALQHIPAFSLSGSCYLLDASTKDRAAKDIPAIYDSWQKRYNMMVVGTPYDFQFIPKANPYKDQVFTYVYLSAQKEPLAYMTFQNNTDPAVRSLQCTRFFYINKEGLQGLLALARSFASDYRSITFCLPDKDALDQLLPEWSMGAVECRSVAGGMVRVLNVQKALQDAAYRGSGQLSIRIADPYIPENNGIFTVCFSEGRCESVTRQDGASSQHTRTDVSLSIASFSALLSGSCKTDAVYFFDDAEVNGSYSLLSQVFYRKPVYITTYF